MSVPGRSIVPQTGRVSRRAGVLLCGLFLAAMLAVPVVQTASELGRGKPVQALDIFRGLPQLGVFHDGRGPTILEHIQQYEKTLERQSVVSDAVQPYVQWLQLTAVRAGNEKVLVARDDWLFYRPGVSFVTARGFLEAPAAARPNEKQVAAADIVPIILSFRDQLRARGIELVLAPVPVKATIYPDQLVAGYDLSKGPPANRSMEEFYRRLRDGGVTVLDLTDRLWAARQYSPGVDGGQARTQGRVYLPYDSHWTPLGMRVYAEELCKELRSRFEFLRGGAGDFKTAPREVANRGDLFNMLKLPAWSGRFPPTRVTIEQVLRGDGRLVESDEESPVVLLGDSATNIFSVDEGMGWGDHAGLAEHLSMGLGLPIQWIAVNGGGPSLTRQRLAREDLSGKKLVIWEFLMRDLTDPLSEWKDVLLPPAKKAAGEAVAVSQPPGDEPAPVILQLARDLQARDVALVLAPVPSGKTLADPSALQPLLSQLQAGGVIVIDTATPLHATPANSLLLGSSGYLSPLGVDLLAKAVAKELRQQFKFLQADMITAKTVAKEIPPSAAAGEFAGALPLTVQQVQNTTVHALLEPTEQSRLVVVGGRMLRLYSDPSLGLGDHAGLGEHLSMRLGRPLQWVAVDAAGSAQMQQALRKFDVARKAAVLWMPSSDDLLAPAGKWAPVSLAPAAGQAATAQAAARLVIRGRIIKKSPPPDPDVGEIYPDTINYTLFEVLSVVEGSHSGKELLAVEWSQKDKDFLAPFRYELGQECTLELIPLRQAENQDKAIRKANFVDTIERYDLPAYWVVQHQ